MILACHNLKKSFGDRIIVDTGSFHIEEREKAALLGKRRRKINNLQNDHRRRTF